MAYDIIIAVLIFGLYVITIHNNFRLNKHSDLQADIIEVITRIEMVVSDIVKYLKLESDKLDKYLKDKE